jgi:hypothetical protein
MSSVNSGDDRPEIRSITASSSGAVVGGVQPASQIAKKVAKIAKANTIDIFFGFIIFFLRALVAVFLGIL